MDEARSPLSRLQGGKTMKRIFRSMKALATAAALGAVAVTGTAEAQDVKVTSYEELLTRVAQLEGDLQSMRANGGLPPAPAMEGQPPMMYGGAPGVPGGCGYQCCDPQQVCDDGGVYVLYENVIVQPYLSQNAAFKVTDPVGSPFNTSVNVVDFDWDMEYSPRIEVGRVNPDGIGWRARYWNFDHSSTRSVAGDIGFVTADVSVGVPNISTIVDLDGTMETEHSIDVYVVDFEALVHRATCDGAITGSAGLRYARSVQTYDAQSFDVAGGVDDTIRSRHSFQGIGPTFAGEVRRRVGSGNLSVFINGRASLLYGESDWFAVEDFPDEHLSVDGDTDLVTIGEAQLGLEYRRGSCSGREFFARAALEAQYWHNAGTGSIQTASNDLTQNAQDPREADLGFFGISIGTGVEW
jgi:Legionella pneumophila major outer membrane protein precursor